MYQHFYKFEYGDYAFYAGVFKPEIEFRTLQVSVLYDQDTGTLLKHGRAEDVKKWLAKYEKEGGRGFWNMAVVEFPPDYPVEDINAMIHTSGSVPYHVDRASRGDYTPQKSE